MDWARWHADYDDPASPLAHRLRLVQEQIRAALDAAPPGPLTAVSVCAGQGRDLIEVLATHPRGGDVRARLVETDPRNVAAARAAVQSAGLAGVQVSEGDAGLLAAYAGFVPADLVVACGVFGNLTDDDVRRTVAACGQLCADGGVVVWTRHRRAPDLVPALCDWFGRDGFTRIFVSEPELGFCVGAHRRTGAPQPLRPGERMFTFVGSDVLRARRPAAPDRRRTG